MEQAIDWAKRIPFMDDEVEVCPCFEPEDFGESFTPDLREANEKVSRKEAENRARLKTK